MKNIVTIFLFAFAVGIGCTEEKDGQGPPVQDEAVAASDTSDLQGAVKEDFEEEAQRSITVDNLEENLDRLEEEITKDR